MLQLERIPPGYSSIKSMLLMEGVSEATRLLSNEIKFSRLGSTASSAFGSRAFCPSLLLVFIFKNGPTRNNAQHEDSECRLHQGGKLIVKGNLYGIISRGGSHHDTRQEPQ
jgi:hypothetical protein